MKLATLVRYAVRILFELKKNSSPLSISLISRKTGIAPRTVENLHASLSRSGLTAGTVGARGGISLSVPLQEISLGRLIAILDEGVDFSVCCGEKANECPNQLNCVRRAVWNGISAEFQKSLDNISLEEILRQYPRE
ncbi:MAG: Rrf2 family transcriptional regulator [Deltaproteobacteria bacterium]|jgi:Rrf2 family iron-sulfur cluster assembly transcriptional regulator|nr:Rrf2 family transcriptional regulator [Deltaproteobacteria bacterium]